MIEYVDTDQRADGSKASRQRHIVWTRRRIATRMVVREHDSRGIRQERGLEHFARMHQRAIERPSTHFVVRDQSMLGREAQNAEDLTRFIAEQTVRTAAQSAGRDNTRGTRVGCPSPSVFAR